MQELIEDVNKIMCIILDVSHGCYKIDSVGKILRTTVNPLHSFERELMNPSNCLWMEYLPR